MSLSMLESENLQHTWTLPRFSKWRLVRRFFGIVRRGEEIDPRQEAYYEHVKRIAELLQKEDNMVITLLGEQKSGNEEGYKNSGPHATGAEHHTHPGALLTS
jgi:hypothetical protein